ncbi:hypothetical protein N136_03557, partial [Leifsonia aquatica ATCC 14665]
MEHQSQVEIERKYDVAEDTVPPDLVGVGAVAVVAEPETAELVATYYDTGDLTLARNRIAVRARRGGADEGWHVKLAPGDEGRVELGSLLGSDRRGRARLRPSRQAASIAEGEGIAL